jgi:hypothetical protein
MRTRTWAPCGHVCSATARCPATAAPIPSRAPERIEERVALPVDLVSAGGLEDLAEQTPMVGDHIPVFVAELLQQASRALVVGEQEGDGAARKSHAVTVQR